MSGSTRRRNQHGAVLIWVAGVILLLMASVVWLIVGIRGGARGIQEAFGSQRYESTEEIVQSLDSNGFAGCAANVSDDKPSPESGLPPDTDMVLCEGSGYLVGAGWFPDAVPSTVEELMCAGAHPIGGSVVVGGNWFAYAFAQDDFGRDPGGDDQLSAEDAELVQSALGGEVQTVSCG